MRYGRERRMLHGAVAIAAIVPVVGGVLGVLDGPVAIDVATRSPMEGHVRYLSGLLLGIGLVFWSLIPAIETRTTVFRVLTGIVVIGGIGRLSGIVVFGDPGTPTTFGALVMELVVAPLLCLWQHRISSRGVRRNAETTASTADP